MYRLPATGSRSPGILCRQWAINDSLAPKPNPIPDPKLNYKLSVPKKEENRSPIVINWHSSYYRVCIPQSQPIIAQYRQATAGRRYTTFFFFCLLMLLIPTMTKQSLSKNDFFRIKLLELRMRSVHCGYYPDSDGGQWTPGTSWVRPRQPRCLVWDRPSTEDDLIMGAAYYGAVAKQLTTGRRRGSELAVRSIHSIEITPQGTRNSYSQETVAKR